MNDAERDKHTRDVLKCVREANEKDVCVAVALVNSGLLTLASIELDHQAWHSRVCERCEGAYPEPAATTPENPLTEHRWIKVPHAHTCDKCHSGAFECEKCQSPDGMCVKCMGGRDPVLMARCPVEG